MMPGDICLPFTWSALQKGRCLRRNGKETHRLYHCSTVEALLTDSQVLDNGKNKPMKLNICDIFPPRNIDLGLTSLRE